MANDFLLKEDGGFLLNEDGTSKIILEQPQPTQVVPWRPVWTDRRQGS